MQLRILLYQTKQSLKVADEIQEEPVWVIFKKFLIGFDTVVINLHKSNTHSVRLVNKYCLLQIMIRLFIYFIAPNEPDYVLISSHDAHSAISIYKKIENHCC